MKTVFYLLFVGFLCVSCTNRRVDNTPKQTTTIEAQVKPVKKVYEPPYDNSYLANKDTVYYKNLRYVENREIAGLTFKSFSVREDRLIVKIYNMSTYPMKDEWLRGFFHVRNIRENEIIEERIFVKTINLAPKMSYSVDIHYWFMEKLNKKNNVVDVYFEINEEPVLVCTIACVDGRTLKVKR